ncbi:MAG: sodium:proton antiporter [Planctomycetota bacterium]|nr:MAG: sodium:proton antiporter [Planctomycetota bacterium]
MPGGKWKSNVHKPVILAIFSILAGYALITALGWTDTTTAGHAEHAAHDAPAEHGQGHEAEAAEEIPGLLSVIPFTILLGAIAVLPLIEHTAHWWENNLHKFYVAGTLGMITLLYLALGHPDASVHRAAETLRHSIEAEYIPFIVLLFSLYTISGGIRITGDLRAHSLTNAVFIAAGGSLASFIGTTGAAMLLIRPLLETNRERKHVAHTVVFFIFVVCNCGGLLLPIGDPPLFLGYLNGVDFLWTLSLWRSWLFVNGMLLTIYFLVDHFYYYRHETTVDIVRDERRVRPLRFSGVWPNGLLLLGVILSVALLDPSKPVPGTDWQPWLYLREMVQLGLVAASLLLGPQVVRDDNNFDYFAIIEVAALFIGIFVAMQPALEILNARGSSLGINSPQEFYWATGFLSAVLDNAPTYLVFFKTAQTLPAAEGATLVAGVAESILRGISLGAVLMGAMTYIGNGPNFMVKSIAEQAGVRMPSFFGYVRYSVGYLLPVLALAAWLFLPH